MNPSQQTLRLAGLPPNTQVRDVLQFFNERISRKHGGQIVESVGPICAQANRNTKCSTVSFSTHNTAQKALDLPLSSRHFSAEHGGAADHITIDAEFKDLTTIHSADNPATGKPDIDIVALHGLRGHGWNSFTTSRVFDQAGTRYKETNWLRDNLPQLLEQDQRQKVYSRVMTYGYNADVWMTNSVADIGVPVNNLLHYLAGERGNDPRRPLFFVAHSLGGIVVKQAIINLANEAITQTMVEDPASAKEYNFPVKGCMFFGVPNQGSEKADMATSFLNVLSLIFKVNKNMIKDLEYKSQQLANVAGEFRTIRHTHSIPVISFYETAIYNHTVKLIVQPESAIMDYEGCPRPFGIDRNHKEMVRFTDDNAHALEPALQFLAALAQRAIAAQSSRSRPRPRPPPIPQVIANPSPSQESLWSTLSTYDTVFLIDDSPSMAGENWDLVKDILDYSTEMATRYDPNGIDVHFFNNHASNADDIKDPAVARQIIHNVALRGSTPLLDQLSRHLDNYLYKFEQNRHQLNFRGYNLIVLTDGEPDEDYEDPDDISDAEDAKRTSPVYRLIRKKIVETAQDLDKARAPQNQVGIQFCQIGDAKDVQVFFQYLDDRIKGKYKLKRDMVDTVRCLTSAELTHEFYEKLLLGSINRSKDHSQLPANTQNDSTRPPVSQLYHGASLAQNVPAGQPTYLPHRPYNGGNGNARASQHGDYGESIRSTSQSISDPITATQRSLLAAQYVETSPRVDGYRSSREYTPTYNNNNTIPERVPSPRVFSFPPQQTVVSEQEAPVQKVNKSATHAVSGPSGTGRRSWWPGS